VHRLATGLLTVLLAAAAVAQQPPGGAHDEAPPAALAGPVAAALASGGRTHVIGAARLDFWFVKALPAGSGSGAPSWIDVAEGSLVGAVRIGADFRDVRGRVVRPGVYTLRYGIQPDNGDHLGVSPYREFLLLLPAALDTDTAARGHDGTIEISKRTAGGSHPAVWSIDPPVTTAPVGAELRNDELDLRSFTMEVPVVRAGKSGALRFGLVLIGKIEA
jgi:hypothetical protein